MKMGWPKPKFASGLLIVRNCIDTVLVIPLTKLTSCGPYLGQNESCYHYDAEPVKIEET
jgi:hypothetical protein